MMLPLAVTNGVPDGSGDGGGGDEAADGDEWDDVGDGGDDALRRTVRAAFCKFYSYLKGFAILLKSLQTRTHNEYDSRGYESSNG